MPSETDCLGGSTEMGLELCELLGRQGWSQGESGAIFCRMETIYYHHTQQSRTHGADYEFYLLNYWRIKRSRNVWDPSSSFIKGPPSRLQINFLHALITWLTILCSRNSSCTHHVSIMHCSRGSSWNDHVATIYWSRD